MSCCVRMLWLFAGSVCYGVYEGSFFAFLGVYLISLGLMDWKE